MKVALPFTLNARYRYPESEVHRLIQSATTRSGVDVSVILSWRLGF